MQLMIAFLDKSDIDGSLYRFVCSEFGVLLQSLYWILILINKYVQARIIPSNVKLV